MPKIKVDVSGVSEEDAKSWGSGFEQPKPGVYRSKVKELTPGFSKGDKGEQDRNRPRLEVIYEIIDKRYPGAQLWEYISLPGSEGFNDAAKKKMAQLLRACGIKAASELDTAKLVGKVVRVRVRGGKSQDGESYRGEFSAVYKDDDGDVSLTGGEESASSGDLEDETLTDDETLAEDETLSEEDGGTDWDARLAELMAMQGTDLQAIAREWKAAGWDIKIGGKKADVAAAVVAVEQEAAAAGDGEEEALIEEDEPLLDDDETLAEDSNDYLTEDQLKAMDPKELMKLAKESFDIDAKKAGITNKSGLVAAILEAQAAPSGDDDETLPF